jgi:hypothetical protein
VLAKDYWEGSGGRGEEGGGEEEKRTDEWKRRYEVG